MGGHTFIEADLIASQSSKMTRSRVKMSLVNYNRTKRISVAEKRYLFLGLNRFVLSSFLADRTNGRAIATLYRLSVRLSVCDVMYCG